MAYAVYKFIFLWILHTGSLIQSVSLIDTMKFGVENNDQEKMVYFPLTNLPLKQIIY